MNDRSGLKNNSGSEQKQTVARRPRTPELQPDNEDREDSKPAASSTAERLGRALSASRDTWMNSTAGGFSTPERQDDSSSQPRRLWVSRAVEVPGRKEVIMEPITAAPRDAADKAARGWIA